MGYDTSYYGKLRFTRRLTSGERDWIETIIRAGNGRYSTPEIETEIEAEREARRKPERAQMIDCAAEAARRAELLGFVMPEGGLRRVDFRITARRDGIEWNGGEKFYHPVGAVNFILANAHRKIPDFGLRGSIYAETEFRPCRWLIRIGRDARAHGAPCGDRLWRYRPGEYAARQLRRWRLRFSDACRLVLGKDPRITLEHSCGPLLIVVSWRGSRNFSKNSGDRQPSPNIPKAFLKRQSTVDLHGLWRSGCKRSLNWICIASMVSGVCYGPLRMLTAKATRR